MLRSMTIDDLADQLNRPECGRIRDNVVAVLECLGPSTVFDADFGYADGDFAIGSLSMRMVTHTLPKMELFFTGDRINVEFAVCCKPSKALIQLDANCKAVIRLITSKSGLRRVGVWVC